jgi:hypothetical protein
VRHRVPSGFNSTILDKQSGLSPNRTGTVYKRNIEKRFRVSFRVTIVSVEKQQVLHILNVSVALRYPERKAHAPYYIIVRGLSRCAVFFYSIS